MDRQSLINLVYLAAAMLFIFGIQGMSRPRTARRANLLGALGMLLAIAATCFDRHIVDFKLLAVGMIIGSLAGATMALRVQMTAMPQMVALLNGFGGGASFLVAGVDTMINLDRGIVLDNQTIVAIVASGLIGAVTLTGSVMAYLKLDERLISGRSVVFAGQQVLNAALTLVVLLLAAWFVGDPVSSLPYWLIVVVASLLGVLLVLPIGGADMPVVISLLNSYSGLAGAATGFVLQNSMLVIAGSLVGASGIILSKIMCDAMNRSLFNVLFGVMSAAGDGPKADEVYAGKVKSISAEEAAMVFDNARRVVIVPGYGLAVAQAQHAVRDLATALEARGATVEYAIHPVAGRMPGHMNVLLAEANVPYEQMKEMESINPQFEQVDVALVIGANDVVNPLARTDPTSPIAGMPILDVDKARTVIVVKRSLSPGFAGIPNPLFAADNTLMYFGDGQKAVLELVSALEST